MIKYGESKWLHALHAGSGNDGGSDPLGYCGGRRMIDADRPGWVVFTEGLGHSVSDVSGVDYRMYADRGLGVIARLSHGYGREGTIPPEGWETNGAIRIERFVANSPGCHIWVIGNEMNHVQERPDGAPITPERYAEYYLLARMAIRGTGGHEEDVVMAGAVAPWYVDQYSSHWLEYYREMLDAILELATPEALCWHGYTHGSDPDLPWSEGKMTSPGYEDMLFHLQHLRQFWQVTPGVLKGVPIYITECNQGGAWDADAGSRGWMRNVYQAAAEWRMMGMDVRCVAMYRWPAIDQWVMADKPGVVEDFDRAMASGYAWNDDGGDEMVQVVDGFESGFAPFGGVGELTVPVGWTPAWVQGTEAGVLVRPEFKPAGTPQIRNGTGAVAIHSSYATIDGALYRQFEVPRGAAVTVSVWMMKEAAEGGHSMRVGIDPTGGVQFTSAAVVWAEWYSQYSADWLAKGWRERVVETTAASNMVTVYLHSKVDSKEEGTHAHFDDLALAYEAGPTPPAPGTGAVPVVRLYVDERLVWEGAVGAGVDARVPALLDEVVAKVQEARGLV